MPSLCDDLLAETAVLDALVRPLDDAGWLTPTAAPGWTVHDQVAHLAHFDEDARIGAVDPERFAGMRAEVLRDVDGFVARATEEHDAAEAKDEQSELRRIEARFDELDRKLERLEAALRGP